MLIHQRTYKKLRGEALGIDATNCLKDKLEGAIDGDDGFTIRTELVGASVNTSSLLYIGDATVSINEEMIGEGYAPYDEHKTKRL